MKSTNVLSLLLVFCISSGASGASLTAGGASAEASLEYLRRAMDQFHDRFPVYDDISSAGNHFHAWGRIPDQNAAVSTTGAWTDRPHSGATAIRAEFRNEVGPNFGGLYFLNGVLPAGARSPQLNFGTVPNAGIDLVGATALTFWARGDHGGERIDFFMGGVGRNAETGQPMPGFPFPDSTPAVKTTVTLTPSWQKHRLELAGKDLHYVLGGFGWAASDQLNPAGAVFYLDDIEYELGPAARQARLEEPRFVRSFTTAPYQFQPEPVGDFDFVNRNVAHTYDNALALLAFLADGGGDSLRRARLIGDAFVFAMDHDRSYNGDRVRDAYAAGDLSLPPGWTPNGRIGTVPVSGFFDEAHQQFVEIEQEHISTGNNAWVMIALEALYGRTGDHRYLDAVRDLAEFVSSFRNDEGIYKGFQGGLDAPETATPQRRPWASTEHNLDVFAAFNILGALSEDPRWAQGATHARQFVESMWDAGRACNLAGTIDPQRRNEEPGQLPVDVQSWAVLAVPGILAAHPALLACAERYHRTRDGGFSGFDFNDDRDGVWFEGTAHMAVAYQSIGNTAAAEALERTLAAAQTASFGDGSGVAAASRDGLTTGFDFRFFRRLHVGATAWNVFAQLGFNPFSGSPATPVGSCVPAPAVLCLNQSRFRVTANWDTAVDTSGPGTGVSLTPESGYFWFFSPLNVEVLVKLLDGCQFSDHFWFFAAGLTNVGVDLVVEDTRTGEVRRYRNPRDTPFPPILDTQAFPTCSP